MPPAIVTCGCDRPHYARGMCQRHYDRWMHAERRRKRPITTRQYNRRGCSEPGCPAEHHALGFCASHYWLNVVKHRHHSPPRPYYRNPLVPQIEELAQTMSQSLIAKLLKISRMMVIGVVDRARKQGRLPDPKAPPYVPPREIFPRRHGCCLWMYGDPRDQDSYFCGEDVFIYGEAWCIKHRAVVYVRRSEFSNALTAAAAD